jgi:hypothetical protein
LQLKELILFELQALFKSIILLRQVINLCAAPPSPHPALVVQNEALLQFRQFFTGPSSLGSKRCVFAAA